MTRQLVVSPYPPWRDGIAAYALAEVRERRRKGEDVEVCSPEPSAAHHHLRLATALGVLRLGLLARRFDRTVVHFHPAVFYPARRPGPVGRVTSPVARLVNGLALAMAFRAGAPVELLVHELPVSWATGRRPWEMATRIMLRAAATVSVHDDTTRRSLVEQAAVPAHKLRLVPHGEHFAARTTAGRDGARASLGIAPDAMCFVCVGFLGRHKGFDRAVAAFAALGDDAAAAELHVVGSARGVASEDLGKLRRLVRATPGVQLHEGFVSDERFDRWLLAADAVVLPYREIWSSSVAARAVMLGRPVIASDVGGLREQLAGVDGAVLVRDDEELRQAMAAVLGRAPLAAPPSGEAPHSLPVLEAEPAPEPGPPERPEVAAVIEEIRRRADAARGTPYGSTGAAGGVPELPPAPVSPAVRLAKAVLARLPERPLRPLIVRLARLRRATMEAVDSHRKDPTP